MTSAGGEGLRAALVAGAHRIHPAGQDAVEPGPRPGSPTCSKSKPEKLDAVALANKTARIAWKLTISGEAETAAVRRSSGRRSGPHSIGSRRRAHQLQPAHMLAEGADDVMVLAVHVVGDGAAHGDELRARHDRQAPAARDHQPLDVAQHDAGLADQPAGFASKEIKRSRPACATACPPGLRQASP